MKSRLAVVSLLFSICFFLFAGVFFACSGKTDSEDVRSQQIVAVNELEQLAKKGEIKKMQEKSAELQEDLRSAKTEVEGTDIRYLFLGVAVAVYSGIIFWYIYVSILRPFDKMKIFAKEIAQGNFDLPLAYERSNYFGDFTWAFDSMRKEITRARSCEKEAVENNKTVIATLSHDIKTPIASLRAYAEGLEANMDSSAEKREKYISVIIRKCDEVAGLTNDLFLHSISSLDKLEISMETFELCGFLHAAVSEITVDEQNVCLTLPDQKIMVSADKNRLVQVCENIINNAAKYAGTVLDLTVTPDGDSVRIIFRDYGSGIEDEDLPFVFDKFYRGKNCGNRQGSGLGLYIVKYIIEKMNGKVFVHSYRDRLEVTVALPAARSK